jgi:signal transduction histidine kinase
VNNLSPPRNAVENSFTYPPAAGISAQLRALAELGARVRDGAACLIAWRGLGKASTVRASADSRSGALLDSLLAAVERDPRYSPNRNGNSLQLGQLELTSAIRRRSHDITFSAAAVSIASAGEPAARATVVLSALPGTRASNLQVSAELVARAAMGVIRSGAANASCNFWRKRTSEAADRLVRSRSESSSNLSERRRIDRAVVAAEKLRPRNRFAGLGSLVAKLGPWEAWMIATAEDDALRVTAASGVLAPAATLVAQDQRGSAMADCFRRQATIIRVARPAKGAVYAEDRAFARFASYVCVPFENGAIALAANEAADVEAVRRIEALAARLNPLIAKWMLEAETDRLRRLVRNLGLRMFGAVDSERARIARDLHDHQAQLLAAARIGLEAGPDEARGIFKQLEDALRLRVRELRPPTLGRTSLAEGLRYELRRLTEAGIKGRLIHADQMNALTRPIQQVCYQVAREALANVMRHAGASRVEIGVEKRGDRVRLSILDNGRGMRESGGSGGMGLRSLNERLELIGGRLRIESKAGSTRLVAEIPELE